MTRDDDDGVKVYHWIKEMISDLSLVINNYTPLHFTSRLSYDDFSTLRPAGKLHQTDRQTDSGTTLGGERSDYVMKV